MGSSNGAIMSVPLWDRPPDRGAPHELLKWVRPGVKGQMMPPMIGPVEPPEPPDPPLAATASAGRPLLGFGAPQTGLLGLVFGLQLPAPVAQIVICT